MGPGYKHPVLRFATPTNLLTPANPDGTMSSPVEAPLIVLPVTLLDVSV
jgi:hypothetical protein